MCECVSLFPQSAEAAGTTAAARSFWRSDANAREKKLKRNTNNGGRPKMISNVSAVGKTARVDAAIFVTTIPPGHRAFRFPVERSAHYAINGVYYRYRSCRITDVIRSARDGDAALQELPTLYRGRHAGIWVRRKRKTPTRFSKKSENPDKDRFSNAIMIAIGVTRLNQK